MTANTARDATAAEGIRETSGSRTHGTSVHLQNLSRSFGNRL